MLLTSPLSSPLKNPVRDVFSPAGGSSLTAQVQALFAGGKVGGMWDKGDIATLFQDAATPVTAVTQPIGIVLDKSQGLVLGTETVPSTNWNGGYTTNGAKQIPTGWFEYTPANVASATVLPNSYQFTATAHLAGIQVDSLSAIGKFNKYTIRARKTAFVSGTPTLQLYTGAWQEIIPSGAAIGDWYTKTIYALATHPVIICSFHSSASWEVEYLTVKEQLGNHATQPTAGSRPLFSARKNLLQKTEVLNDGSWTKQASVTVTDNAVVAPNGSMTGTQVDWTAASVSTGIFQSNLSTSAGIVNTKSVYVRADSAGGTVNIADPDSTVGSASVTLTTNWQLLALSEPSPTSAFGIWIRKTASSPNRIYVAQPQCELSTTATKYQRVNTASDYDTVGFPAFAQFDATDDALLFPAITFGGAFNTFVAGKVTGGTIGVHLWRTADFAGGFWGVYQSGSATSPTGIRAGSPTYSNNGIAVSPQTREQIYTLINGVDSVLESTGIVLSAETALQFSGYPTAQFQGNAHRVLMISGTLTAGEKLLCRQWCAEGNGVTVV